MELVYYVASLAGYIASFMVVGAIALLPVLWVTGCFEFFWPGDEQ